MTFMGEACGEKCRSIKVGGLQKNSGQGVFFIIGFLWMAGFSVSLLSPVEWFKVVWCWESLSNRWRKARKFVFILSSYLFKVGAATQKDGTWNIQSGFLNSLFWLWLKFHIPFLLLVLVALHSLWWICGVCSVLSGILFEEEEEEEDEEEEEGGSLQIWSCWWQKHMDCTWTSLTNSSRLLPSRHH